MCDLAYVILLRERVRWVETEQKHIEAFGPAPTARFVPWIIPASAEQIEPRSAHFGR
jgi:hypothetical protein